MLGSARARDNAECCFELAKDRCLPRGEAHVAGQHELAAGAAHTALNFGDGNQAADTQASQQPRQRRLAGELNCLLPVFAEPGHVVVGYEMVGVGAPEHQNTEGVVGLGLEGDQVADQFWPHQFIGGAAISAKRTPACLLTGECLEKP
ncbi:hypothetical protein MES5069_660002 [Mesorhizobium escarrei]|uniref:Uncharacterized protein n=1 Tax=Mesorhizobium escarrei TaxID=666018 RepID=A0ABN8KD51_9HYPH|nr:hypothetical protein [Mesorhizobium escarrei]CAH2408188.1 hypothetical protein MES5069_660002 [Mesorhizobium escarrei]